MKLKYIILTDGTPVIFGMETAHSDIARPSQVVAAGFVELGTYTVGNRNEIDLGFITKLIIKCSGESVSLGKKSRPEDTKILTFKVFNEGLS